MARSTYIKTLLTLLSLSTTINSAPTKRGPTGIPSFAIEYAPLVYLHSDDIYRPSDISAQVTNTSPQVSFNTVSNAPNPLTLDNLNQLNNLGGPSVYLTSKIDAGNNDQQTWLKGVAPDASGKTNGAVTTAVIVNQKDDRTTDVFYMYFFAYNKAPPVLGIQFGNHVGDWEHVMVRFVDGKPTALWYSQHATGQAFTYDATRKNGKRPLAYSAKGSHATYAIDGKHDHTIPNFNLPGGFLEDDTNAGILWDPLLSAYYYSYNAGTNVFTPYVDDITGTTPPVNWLYFNGKWGDEQYKDSKPGQYNLFGQRRWTSGPTGPIDKGLNRGNVCPDGVKPCFVRPFLTVKRDSIDVI